MSLSIKDDIRDINKKDDDKYTKYQNNHRPSEEFDRNDRNDDRDRNIEFDRNSDREYSNKSKSSKKEEYTLSNLVQFLAQRRYYVSRQFVHEDSVVFIKVRIESIGENILIYFPSKFNISPIDNIPITEIIPFELTEQDLLSVYQREDNEFRESFSEFHTDDLKNPESFSQEHYRALTIQEKNKEYQIRKTIIRYTDQLNKFKSCFMRLKYKVGILSNDVLCDINRHNEIECYLIKSEEDLVKNMIDEKTDSVLNIEHELYFVIDLPNFYDKMPQLAKDVISLYKNFYSTLSTAHTRFTAIAEHRFRNYQLLIGEFINMYNKKHKFLEMLETLTGSLDKANTQEEKLIQKLELIESKESIELSKASDKSYRLTKNEKELQKVRELKMKIINTIHEIKTKYHTFILTFDYVITNIVKQLKNVEADVGLLGIRVQDLVVQPKKPKKGK